MCKICNLIMHFCDFKPSHAFFMPKPTVHPSGKKLLSQKTLPKAVEKRALIVNIS